MALEVKQGVITAPTTNGTDTVISSLTNPKAIFLWTTAQTATGSTNEGMIAYGVATYDGAAAQQWAITFHSDDNVDVSDVVISANTTRCLRGLDTARAANATTVDFECQLISMDSTSITLDWIDAPTSAIKVNYLVLGGSDLSKARAGSYNDDATTDPQSVTINTGWGKPDVVLFGSRNDSSSTIDRLQATSGGFMLGAAVKDVGERATSFRETDAQDNTANAMMQGAFATIETGASAVLETSILGASSGWPTDGFAVDKTITTGTAEAKFYLALQGTFSHAVGSSSTLTTGGPQNIASGFGSAAIRGALLWGWNLATNSAIQTSAADQAGFFVGGTDGTNEAYSAILVDDAAGNASLSRTHRVHSETKALGEWTPAQTDGGSPTQQAEADSSFSGANLVLTYSDLDSVAREFNYLILGDAPSSVVTKTHNVDAVVLKTQIKTHNVDAVIQKTFTITHLVDAVVQLTQIKTHNSDAVVLKTLNKTYNIDTVVLKTQTVAHGVDASIVLVGTKTHAVDGIIFKTSIKTYLVDGIVQKTQTLTHSSDAIAVLAVTKTHQTDALLLKTQNRVYQIDAIALKAQTRTQQTDAIAQRTFIIGNQVDAIINKTFISTYSVDSLILKTQTAIHQVDAYISLGLIKIYSVDAIILKTITRTHQVDAFLTGAGAKTHQVDAILLKTLTRTHLVDSLLQAPMLKTHAVDAMVFKVVTYSHTADVIIQKTQIDTHSSDAIIVSQRSVFSAADAIILETQVVSAQADAVIRKQMSVSYATDALVAVRVVRSHSVDAQTLATRTIQYNVDSVLFSSLTRTHLVDAVVYRIDVQDALIDISVQDYGIGLTVSEYGITVEVLDFGIQINSIDYNIDF